MVYHLVEMGPSDGQKSDLAQGNSVKLSPEHFSGDSKMYLTGTQVKRMQAAAESGKGFTLKFSPAQIKYNAKNGAGIFGDILKTVGHAGVDFLGNKIGLGVSDVVGGPPIQWGKPARPAPTMSRNIDRFLSDEAIAAMVKKLFPHGQVGSGVLSDMLGSIGLGVSPRKGKGILSDAAKWLGHKGVDFLGDQLSKKTGLGVGQEITRSDIHPTHAFLGVGKKKGSGLYL